MFDFSQVLAVIPARYASSRLPGKPLALIHGKPMIQRVYEQSSVALPNVVVATDDARIFDFCKSMKINVVMTSSEHTNGTSRCFEASQIYAGQTGQSYDTILNIQGDEPFIAPEQIVQLTQIFFDSKVEIASLIKKIENPDDLLNPSKPKVVKAINGDALYFSRSAIPYVRDEIDQHLWLQKHTFFKHIGLYGFKANILEKLVKLTSSPLEGAESLEQNRWLEHGFKIRLAETEFESMSVDTFEDLVKINNPD